MAVPLEQFIPLFDKKTKRLQKDVVNTPKGLAEWGALFGKTIAPRRHGYLAKAISWKTTGGQKEARAFVFVKAARNPHYRGKYGRVPRYAAIQHRMALGARTQARTGNPHWMFTLAREGAKRFNKKILIHIQQFIGR